MENEAPKYANWIPEAGGYVANGKVVSKSPIYENGKLKLDVDTSVFGNTQTQNSAVQQTGMQTLNTANSGTDVNWGMTQAGSLANLTPNTAITGSAISTPAVDSPLINIKPGNALDEINRKYQEYVASGNLKGQIDMMVEASAIDGIDRTTQINELWKKRGEKVRTQDNAYLNSIQQIRDAITNTKLRTDLSDEEKAQKVAELQSQEQELLNKQQAYRDMVGYDDQVSKDMQAIRDQTYQDFVSRYMDGITTITNMIGETLQGILNFQYNPYTDPALNIAQGYAVGKVKETMNATGMYDSSMTTRAITKAVSELVPIYEKMSRDEAVQNMQLLQQTASFLIDLDKYEFDMWRTNIEMRWAEANQKQKEIDNAINNANARGYYTNEEALLVGVPAGSESEKARQDAIDKLNKIEEEKRNYDQSIALADYNHALQLDYLREQYNQMKSYYVFQQNHTPRQSSSGGNFNVTVKTEGANGEEISMTMPYSDAVRLGYLSGDVTTTKNNTYIDPETGKTYTIGDGEFLEALKSADGTYNQEKVNDYIKNQMKNADSPATVLRDLNEELVIKEIQKLFVNDFGGDRGKSMQAFKDAYSKIEDFSTLVQSSEVPGVTNALIGNDEVGGLLHKDVNELIRQIDNSKGFDDVFGDWDVLHGNEKTQLEDSKINAKKDVYDLLKNSNDKLLSEKVATDYRYPLTKDFEKVEKNNEKRITQSIANVTESPLGRLLTPTAVNVARIATDKLVDSLYPNI